MAVRKNIDPGPTGGPDSIYGKDPTRYDSRRAEAISSAFQLDALARETARAKKDKALEGKGAGRPGPKQFPGDTRALNVLRQLYDDPILDAFVAAAQLNPQV